MPFWDLCFEETIDPVIIINIMNVLADPWVRLKNNMSIALHQDYERAVKAGIDCSKWTRETQERILGASYEAVFNQL